MSQMNVKLLVQIQDLASQGLKQLGETGQKSGEKIEESAKKAGGAFSGMRASIGAVTGALGALGVAVSFQALVNSFKNVNAELERLYDLSQATGIDVSKLAGYSFASSQLGTSLDSIIGSFRRISVAIVEARDPLSDSSVMFNALGIELDKIKNARPEDVFFQITDALAKQGSEAEKNVIAQQLLGRSYGDLKVIVAAGREEWAKLIAEQKILNPVTFENAKAADELGDSWGKLGEAWKGVVGNKNISIITSQILDLTTAMLKNGAARGMIAQMFTGTIGSSISGLIGPSSATELSPEAVKTMAANRAKADAAMAQSAERRKEIDLEAARAAQAAGQAAIESSKKAADASIQAQERVTAFIRGEQDKRDALTMDGLERIASREIAEWQKLLDQKLITETQFQEARVAIASGAQDKIDALLEKQFAEFDKAQDARAASNNAASNQEFEIMRAAAVELEKIRTESGRRAADIYESTTVEGVRRAVAQELALIRDSYATREEIAAATIALNEDMAAKIEEINLRAAEKTNDVLGGVKQGIMDFQRDFGTGFQRARQTTQNAMASMQSGLADLLTASQNASGGVQDAFRQMAIGVAQSIQRMINEWIAAQIMMGIGKMVGGFMSPSMGANVGGSFVSGADPGFNYGAPGFALGTSSFAGGMALVGERGPELVRLPQGSQIHSNSASKAMMNGSGGGDVQPIVVQISVQALDGRSTVQVLSQPEVQDMLSGKIRNAVARDRHTRNGIKGAA